MDLLLEKLLADLLPITYQAGQFLDDFYTKSVKIDIKSDNTPVTEADLFVSQFLIQQLSQLTPHIPILSEEGQYIPLKQRQQWQRYWLIDPLDGTQQFLNRTDQFSILIALIDNNRPVLGIIHAPILNVTYCAIQGKGAYKIENGKTYTLAKRKLDFSQPLNIILGATSSPYKVQQILNPKLSYKFRNFGSSGLKAALVAEGVSDVYIRLGDTGEWDTAAAEVLLAETGGAIYDLQQQPLTYNKRETLTNPHFIVWPNRNQDISSILIL